jgi:LPXTG-motif cell wall-anchored protein
MKPAFPSIRSFGRIGLCVLTLCLGGLGAVRAAAPSAAAFVSPLPVIESFSGETTANSWTALGTAHLTGSALELTPATGGNGAFILDDLIPAYGIDAEFDWETNGSADGMTFFMVDESAGTPTLGGGGGGFGYVGMANAHVAVAFDEYNQRIIVIGGASSGFAVLASAPFDPRGAHRGRVRFANQAIRVDVQNVGGEWSTVFPKVVVDGFPRSVKVGFSAATGEVVAQHLVRNVVINDVPLTVQTMASKDLTTGLITMRSYVQNWSPTTTFSGVTLTASGINATVPSLPYLCQVWDVCVDGVGFENVEPYRNINTYRVVAPTASPGATITSTVTSAGHPDISDTISIDAAAFPTIEFPQRRKVSTSQNSIVLTALHSSSARARVSNVEASHGSVHGIDNQTFEYFPNGEFTGDDNITYSITDEIHTTVGNTFAIVVVGPNDPPTAALGEVSLAEDAPATVLPLTFSDPDNDPVRMTHVGARYGTVTLNDSGTEATYTPARDFNGHESIWIEYTDGIYEVSTDGPTFFFDVTPVDDALRVEVSGFGPGPVMAWEDDGPFTYRYRAFDPDAISPVGPGGPEAIAPVFGTEIPIASVAAAHGTVELSPEGPYLTYNPNRDFFGTDTLTFVFDDGATPPNTFALALAVHADPDDPTATAANVTTDANTAVDIPVALADADGETATIVTATADTGTVTIVGSTLHYVPARNVSGSATITFGISDVVSYDYESEQNYPDDSVDAEYEVVVTINPVDGRPTATAAAATTPEDTAVDIAVTITDLDSTTGLSISAAAALHGTVAIDGTTLHYTPAKDYNGADTVTYSVTDGTHTTVGNTVGVTITAVNDIPVAPAGEPATITATSTGGQPTSVDVDTSDPDDDLVEVTISLPPVNGAATVETKPTNPMALVVGTAGARIVYTPNAGFSGNDGFTYLVSDGHGGSYERTVQVSVTASQAPSSPAVPSVPARPGRLPVTGSNAGQLLGIGFGALLVGAFLLVVQRRRKA